MPPSREMSKTVESKARILIALSADQLEILDELVRAWPASDGKRMNRSRVIRIAIDEFVQRRERNREGWGETEIPPVPMGKIRALIRQKYWTTETAALEYAVNSFLDRLEASLDNEEFERRLLRSRIQADGRDGHRPVRSKTK